MIATDRAMFIAKLEDDGGKVCNASARDIDFMMIVIADAYSGGLITLHTNLGPGPSLALVAVDAP